MKQILIVFLGGGFGSALRYLLAKAFNPVFDKFYLGTFLVNIIGCFLIGLILGISERENLLSSNHTLLLATGFCGGFTTFSAFAFEKHHLLKSGEIGHFFMYLLSSIVFGVLAVMVGLLLSKSIKI